MLNEIEDGENEVRKLRENNLPKNPPNSPLQKGGNPNSKNVPHFGKRRLGGIFFFEFFKSSQCPPSTLSR
jgi:hypothetical protein